MYNYEVMPNLQRILNKLLKKDKAHCRQVMNKIEEIINSLDVEHYKNLRYDLSDYKGVHIGHFVLVFKFEKINNKIKFVDFDHHDVIYKKDRFGK
ncbi:addiction module toxin RelE [Candidatus Pacearchaeota archaeon]|nr:addiction module toxin RelE [Candidatus Pacearchaeota archaeon]